MQLKVGARLLSAISKPYSFDGKSGVSHRVRVLVESEVFACKSTEEQVAALQKSVGKDGEVVIEITSREGVPVFAIGSFREAK